MNGLDILARSLSVPSVQNAKDGTLWQYHSRSDDHSKKACWAIVFDLLQECSLLRNHVENDKVFFGINHEMRDFQQNRKKNLDLVLCTPSSSGTAPNETFAEKANDYGIILELAENKTLAQLPKLRRSPVGSVIMALEAKACMTEHLKARPRLYDELNSSHLTIHGATDEAIAAAFTMVNGAETFISPGRNFDSTVGRIPNQHKQPQATKSVISKITELPRRSSRGLSGFDAISIVVVNCKNDGSPVSILNSSPAPRPGDNFHYETMIRRLSHLYSTRFSHL